MASTPGVRFTLTLAHGIHLSKDVTFVCADAGLEGDKDPEANRNCIQFNKELEFRPEYPNPAKDFLSVEWIATEDDQPVTISLTNSQGVKLW
jgi:hypothetical protein